MELKDFFKKHKNMLEGTERHDRISIPDDLYVSCTGCKKALLRKSLRNTMYVCPECGYHFRISARQRLSYLLDAGSLTELFQDVLPRNVLDFPDYDNKLREASLKSGEKEGVVCGEGLAGGFPCAIFAMDSNFMMGSMGNAVGEKITRLFEYATEKSLPVIGVTVSGGARMQEGMISLMQMAKVSGAVKRHSDAGNLYLTLITDPTSGGVTASFAMLGDIIISEPGALICFAGPRVIAQTIRQKLPDGFQRAEFLLETGFLDDIVSRPTQKEYISGILKIHSGRSFANERL